MDEGMHLKDLQEGFTSFKKMIENHIKNIESQFNAIKVEMQAMRHQIETMMQQFTSMATNLHNVNKVVSSGSPIQNKGNRWQQLIPHTWEIQLRSIRLDFPVFNGNDSHGWLYKVNQFFTFHNTLPHHRLRLVSFHREGKALVWFQDLDESSGLTRWDEFVNALISQIWP